MNRRFNPDQEQRLVSFLYGVEAGGAASIVPNDLRTLLAEVEALKQERDRARAMLAHVAQLIQVQLDNAEMDGLARIHLTIAAEQARLAAQGGTNGL